MLSQLQASARVKPQKAIKPKDAEGKQKKPFIDEEKIASALAKFDVLTTTDNKKRSELYEKAAAYYSIGLPPDQVRTGAQVKQWKANKRKAAQRKENHNK